LFFKYLDKLHLICIDINEVMLDEASHYLLNNKIRDFVIMKSGANDVKLPDGSMDCVFTFNAIHHFDFVKFIENASRIIKKTGFVFIYTRLKSQNAKNIWGRYFPLFLDKETRLYEMEDLNKMIKATGSLNVESVKQFSFRRNSSLEHLLLKAYNRHYSTFSLYTEAELKDSLDRFRKNILEHFDNPSCVEWRDENVMLVLKHKPD
jgi:ubiquinone/menaquinone biosynthesis C-methylase UbiE